MRRSTVTLLACALAAALVATASAAVRFERHAIPGQALSLAVPAPWVAVDASLPPATIAKLSRDNPKLAPYLGQLSGAGSAAKFLALDPAVKSGFATNVNVVVAPIPTVTFDQYRAAIVAEIQRIAGSAKVTHRAVTIDGVRGVRLAYPFRITVGRTYTVSTLQYAFPRRGKSVVVTYTTLPRLQKSYAQTFARSAASIRFG
ncbi:MAG TPA: hypothetical protein VEW90_08820 [Gaiellaceae bacterium]|nr:hypothetical protein [Gaiellaceae bacterium]